MKATKLPSGNYRVQFTVDGKRRSLTFDHKPTQREIALEVQEQTMCIESASEKNSSFKALADEYIEAKRNVLSPSTIRGYKGCLARLSEAFTDLLINSIDNLTIQREVNRLSALYSPKTTKNTYSLIASVMEMFRPDYQLKVQLPQAVKFEGYCPTEEDIKKILEAAKPTRYYVPYCLGILGMRRGEIAALTMDDLDGNILTISKAVYTGENNEHGIKAPKTTESARKLYLPDELVERINEQGYIYDGAESRLWASLDQFQELLGIPHFRFHDLRVYFATYAHLKGIPDKVIQDTAGWKSDWTMKKIYRRSQQDTNEKYQEAFLKSVLHTD